jgi:hypothetical protein
MINRQNFEAGRGHVPSRPLLIISVLMGLTLACGDVRAQSPNQNAAVQQARIFMDRPDAVTSRTERLEAPVDSVTGEQAAADADIGEQWMLRENLPANPFRARASFSLFYTDNVALTRRSMLEDGFAVADVGLNYTRPLGSDWSLGVDVQQSFFRYDRYREFDFESLNFGLGLTYQARQVGNIIFGLQYGLNRLTSGSADDQLYLGNNFSLVATKIVPVTSAGMVEFTGALGYTFADPEDLERAELRFGVAYSLRIARNFVATSAVRLELYDYAEEGRTDLLQSLALGARYELTRWMYLSASVAIARNISTERVFSYRAVNAGVTLAAQIEF